MSEMQRTFFLFLSVLLLFATIFAVLRRGGCVGVWGGRERDYQCGIAHRLGEKAEMVEDTGWEKRQRWWRGRKQSKQDRKRRKEGEWEYLRSFILLIVIFFLERGVGGVRDGVNKWDGFLQSSS
jgi:hypothetical protein